MKKQDLTQKKLNQDLKPQEEAMNSHNEEGKIMEKPKLT